MKAEPQEELVPGAVVLGLKFLFLCEVTAFHSTRCSGASEAELQLTQTSRGVCPDTRFTANNEVLLHRC